MTMDHAPAPQEQIRAAVQTALNEDFQFGDATTTMLFPSVITATGIIRARQVLTVAGLAAALETFRQIDQALQCTSHLEDGRTAHQGAAILSVRGDGRSILTGERVALNFLQHLSGIATLTARFCEAVRGYPVKILDTRKTTPGLRALQKWAVRLGGGVNHRFSLSDGIMIKDNHILLAQALGRTILDCCRAAKAQGRPDLRVIVEVETLDQVPMAVDGGADVVLLDNMTPAIVRQAVDLIKGRARTEVSGGITLQNIRDYAAAGPDFISVGALTHSAAAADLSLDLEIVPPSKASHFH